MEHQPDSFEAILQASGIDLETEYPTKEVALAFAGALNTTVEQVGKMFSSIGISLFEKESTIKLTSIEHFSSREISIVTNPEVTNFHDTADAETGMPGFYTA